MNCFVDFKVNSFQAATYKGLKTALTKEGTGLFLSGEGVPSPDLLNVGLQLHPRQDVPE